MSNTEPRVVQPSLEELLPDPEARELFEEHLAAAEAATLLRSFRRRAGLSQQEVADRLRLTQARISQLESADGRDGPTYGVLRRVAHACGIDLTRILLEAVLPREAYEDRLD
jgi:transcriptional regulator with XRE-family HTH domain